MKRAQFLKSISTTAGALVLLPHWANAWTAESMAKVQNTSILDQAMLASIASTFIPEGSSEPGAIGLGVDKFLNRLFADCYEVSDQEKISRGIEVLNQNAKKLYQQNFNSCSQAEREALILAMELATDEELRWFYKTMRAETIRGYTTSEYVMVNHHNYQMTHSFYQGCVTV